MKSESEAANVWLGIGVNLMLHLCVYCGPSSQTICDRRIIDGNCDASGCWQRGTVTKGYQRPYGYWTKWIKWIYCIIYNNLHTSISASSMDWGFKSILVYSASLSSAFLISHSRSSVPWISLKGTCSHRSGSDPIEKESRIGEEVALD